MGKRRAHTACVMCVVAERRIRMTVAKQVSSFYRNRKRVSGSLGQAGPVRTVTVTVTVACSG